MRVELSANRTTGKILLFEDGGFNIQLEEIKDKKIVDIMYDEIGQLILVLE